MRIITSEITSINLKENKHDGKSIDIEFCSIPLDLVIVLDKSDLIKLKELIEEQLKEEK